MNKDNQLSSKQQSIHPTLWTLGILALSLVANGCGKPTRPLHLDPHIIQVMNEGVGFMGQYNYEQAVAAFEKVVQTAPALTEAKINLAIALFNRAKKEDQDLDRAGKILDEVLSSDPGNVRALYFKGIILQHTGSTADALACFERVAGIKPDDGVVWYLIGLCQQRLGQSPEAALKRAVELRPNLYSAYYQLYQSALRSGDTNKAREYMAQFMTLRQSPVGESIEFPQYNQMGDLALAQPFQTKAKPVSASRFTVSPPAKVFDADKQARWRSIDNIGSTLASTPSPIGSITAADFDLDGRLELATVISTAERPASLMMLKQNEQGEFHIYADDASLAGIRNAIACAAGDYDNDGRPDLFLACSGTNILLKNAGPGQFVNVTESAHIGGPPTVSVSAIFVDADHDGDLDILVCNIVPEDSPATSGIQLWNNNGDGTFRNIAPSAGIACAGSKCLMALFGDVDRDRDADLLIVRADAPVMLFLNDLAGQYHLAPEQPNVQADLGAILQDLDSDGNLDILGLSSKEPYLQLHFGDGKGRFTSRPAFQSTTKTAASWAPIRAMRISDVDLDGDLDIVLVGNETHMLLNNGSGAFVWQAHALPSFGPALDCVELLDVNGDLVPDLLTAEGGDKPTIKFYAGQLTPPSTGLAMLLTGLRERDGRTRSPATAYGVKVTVRAGLHEQTLLHTGQNGGPGQSFLPLIAGLAGQTKADYVAFQWPDGVMQVELGLAAGMLHKISELQRKVSSCPVLFAWNGKRFEFITDFAGVGGLGYYVAPGEYAAPQVLEHIKIEPGKLVPRDGAYELRIAEPMEEAAFIDRLELLAIDHPADTMVFADERLAVNGPLPTHELIVIRKPIYPIQAIGYQGHNCTDQIRLPDRVYAYTPPLDKRYYGFCQSHSLELDFGNELATLPASARLYLFIRGYIEYPYSQTVYAAAQSGVRWEPIRIDRLTIDGTWQTVVRDAGVPGGIDRTMTTELTGLVTDSDRKLRLTSNLEIAYDQVFLGVHIGTNTVKVRSVPILRAEVRRIGFTREYSPDGRLPFIYDYETVDLTAPFHVPKGSYTKYGDVTPLLKDFDDMYVIIGPGDEIAISFDAAAVGECPDGCNRSFILVSHSWCKDMDLYTAEPETLEPLPFRGMTMYPYKPNERPADTPELQTYRAKYNTRTVY